MVKDSLGLLEVAWFAGGYHRSQMQWLKLQMYGS